MAKTEKELEKDFKEFKEKYGKIHVLDVPFGESEFRTLILKPLDRVTYAAGSKIMQKDELQAAETFLRGMYVGGDDLNEVIKDFDSLRAASSLLIEVVGVREGNVRTL